MKKYLIRSKKFWIATAIRAFRTFFEVLGAEIIGAKLVQEVDWAYVLSTSAMATIIAVVIALPGIPEVDEDEE